MKALVIVPGEKDGTLELRDVPEPKMRSAITIASLMAMQRLPQLKRHIANGLNMGLSKQEIIEILIHIAFYAGVPTAVNAFQLAKEVFQENEK
jgi:4-carboxymuconolactone decarboxylase